MATKPALAPPTQAPDATMSRRGFFVKLGILFDGLAAAVVAVPIVGFLLSSITRGRGEPRLGVRRAVPQRHEHAVVPHLDAQLVEHRLFGGHQCPAQPDEGRAQVVTLPGHGWTITAGQFIYQSR